MTTDGSVTELTRGALRRGEERVVPRNQGAGPAFLRAAQQPRADDPDTVHLRENLQEKYDVRSYWPTCNI